MNREVVVIQTGAANLASVCAALRRLDAAVVVSADPDRVTDAGAVVLPGVGAFGPAMRLLRQTRLNEVLRDRLDRNAPLLAICLGLQLLARESEESPGESGLGWLDVTVGRFRTTHRVPQMGWNDVTPDSGCALLGAGQAYFANSFRLPALPEGIFGAWSDYGGRFAAGLERDRLLACQFHPELSGSWGADLLRRWLVRAEVLPC